jgi:hypothetical protein
MIEVAKPGMVISTCSHALEVEHLVMIRHHFKRVEGGVLFDVAVACLRCELAIPHPVQGNEAVIDADVERMCPGIIRCKDYMYLTDDNRIITSTFPLPKELVTLPLPEGMVLPEGRVTK